MQKPKMRNRVSCEAVVGWIVGNTDTAWADNFKHGDVPAPMGRLLTDLFGRTVDQVVTDTTKEGR